MDSTIDEDKQKLLTKHYHYNNKKSLCYNRFKYTFFFVNFGMLVCILYYTMCTYYMFDNKYSKLTHKLDKVTKPIHQLKPFINDLSGLNITTLTNEINNDLYIVNEVVKIMCQYISCNNTMIDL